MLRNPLHAVVSRSFWDAVLPPVILFSILLTGGLVGLMFYVMKISGHELMQQAEEVVQTTATQKAQNLTERLKRVEALSINLQAEAKRLFQRPELFPLPASEPVIERAPNGMYYKSEDNGGCAALYFGSAPFTAEQREWMVRTEALDPMINRVRMSDAQIVLTYLLTTDGLVRFDRRSPFFDGVNIYDALEPNQKTENIMVYYWADKAHNPLRKPNWTNVYLDHIGLGWMATLTAPVDSPDGEMLAIVGIDVTIKHLEAYLSDLPGYAHAILLDRNQNIIFAPPLIEERLGITAIKKTMEPGRITDEFIFPNEFNLLKTPKADIARQMQRIIENPNLTGRFELDGKGYIVSQSAIPQTGWRLLILGDEEALYEAETSLRERTYVAITGAILVLFFFLLILSLRLRRSSRDINNRIAMPLTRLQNSFHQAAQKKAVHPLPPVEIAELDALQQDFFSMAHELAEHRNHLEDEVATRTSELQSANRDLEDTLQRLKDTRDALIRSERLAAVGTLAGGVAHEYNNIHQVIGGYASFLLEQKPEESIQFGLEKIHDASKRASSITENLLQFARTRKAQREPTDINRVIKDMVTIIENEYRTQGIEIHLDLDKIPRLMIDGGQIGQVIMNLMINAHHAMLDAEQKRLSISTRLDGETVHIHVQDSGCGIAESELLNIFTPFYTTKGEHADKGSPLAQVRGTGLGLSVCHAILEDHSAEIDVQSEVGVGTTFLISLPLVPVDADALQNANMIPDGRDEFIGSTILIIDDEEDVREWMRVVLAKEGYQIHEACNGKEAISLLGRETVDLIILDLQMPVLDGSGFLDQFKDLALGSRPGLLIVTGKFTEMNVNRYHDAGVSEILQKPFSPVILVEAVFGAFLSAK